VPLEDLRIPVQSCLVNWKEPLNVSMVIFQSSVVLCPRLVNSVDEVTYFQYRPSMSKDKEARHPRLTIGNTLDPVFVEFDVLIEICIIDRFFWVPCSVTLQIERKFQVLNHCDFDQYFL
jgi:hypothetical protein